MRIWRANFFPPKKGPFEEGAKGSRLRAERPGVRGGGDPRSTMGRLLDGIKDAEYNPHSAVCKLPQPFRMLDKLLSRLVDDAVNLAVERDEARLAARGIAEGTEVLTPSRVVPDVGGVTCVAASADGEWVFAGNDEGELVVVNASSGSVASRTRVLAGSIAAVDAVAVDPPPPPPPRPPTPPPEDTAPGEGDEGAEGEPAEGADADADGPEEEKEEEAPPGDGDDEGGAAGADSAGLALDDIAAAAGGLSPADLRPLYLVAVAGVGGDVVLVAADPITGKIRSEWSSECPVVAAGDAPVTRRADGGADGGLETRDAVHAARFSPDGAALAVTCGGGALAVYAAAKPPVEAFIVSKDDDETTKGEEAKRGGDGAGDDAAKEGEEDAAKEGEKDAAKEGEKDAAEGEDGVAEGEAGEGKSAVDFVAAAAKAPRLTALTWLPADAAARTFGPFPRPSGGDGMTGARDDPAADEGGASADPVLKPESDPSDAGRVGAPTLHFRLTGGRADAAFVTWRGVNRLAMFQLTGATNAPSRLAVVPTLRGESQPAEEEGAGSDSGSDGPPVATAPAGDWTLPFPISAAASGDGGALLALAMIDGSVVLFNARLGAVAKTFRRIGNYGPGLDGYDPTAPPAVHVDDSCVSERTVNTPLAIAALSFWTGDTSDGGRRRSLVAATEAGWLAVFDLDAASSRAEVNPSPVTIRPRGDARVPTAGLTCQTAGSLAFACGVEPQRASKEGSLGEDDDDDDDDKKQLEDGENREDEADEQREPAEKRSPETEQASRDDGDVREAATRWFFRLVDLTGGEGSDLPAALDPPEGHAFAVSPAGIVVHAFAGGNLAVVGSNELPGPAKGPTPSPPGAAEEEGGDGGGTDAAEGGGGDSPGGDSPGGDSPGGDSPGGDSPENPDARRGVATRLCLYALPTRGERGPSSGVPPRRVGEVERASLSPKGANLAAARALHPPDVVGVVLARLRASRGGAEERSKRMRWRHDEILGKLSRDAKVAAMSAVVDKRFALGPAR